jgi:hypothetical protein
VSRHTPLAACFSIPWPAAGNGLYDKSSREASHHGLTRKELAHEGDQGKEVCLLYRGLRG